MTNSITTCLEKGSLVFLIAVSCASSEMQRCLGWMPRCFWMPRMLLSWFEVWQCQELLPQPNGMLKGEQCNWNFFYYINISISIHIFTFKTNLFVVPAYCALFHLREQFVFADCYPFRWNWTKRWAPGVYPYVLQPLVAIWSMGSDQSKLHQKTPRVDVCCSAPAVS